jgi:hypothetical protein
MERMAGILGYRDSGRVPAEPPQEGKHHDLNDDNLDVRPSHTGAIVVRGTLHF